MESAQAKNQALKEAGAMVPTSYEALEEAIKEAFQQLVCFFVPLSTWYTESFCFLTHQDNPISFQAKEGNITAIKEVTPPQIPEDLKIAIKNGKVRAPTHIISTISDDRGI